MHALTGSKDLLFVLATARTEMIKNLNAYKKYHKRVSDIKFEGTQTLGPKDFQELLDQPGFSGL